MSVAAEQAASTKLDGDRLARRIADLAAPAVIFPVLLPVGALPGWYALGSAAAAGLNGGRRLRSEPKV